MWQQLQLPGRNQVELIGRAWHLNAACVGQCNAMHSRRRFHLDQLPNAAVIRVSVHFLLLLPSAVECDQAARKI